MIETFTTSLSERLKEELPGVGAQMKMASIKRISELESLIFKKPEDPVKSSILILLYPNKSEIFTLLVQKTEDGSMHSGQIGFPGGKYEDTDNSLIETALREANEEVGIISDEVEIGGANE